MTTSKPARLIVFKKEDCEPCKWVTATLNVVLSAHPEWDQYISIIYKEENPALVAAYELRRYPTVLIMDADSNVISQKIGSSSLSPAWWIDAFEAITKP